jgi:hypothetical protein
MLGLFIFVNLIGGIALISFFLGVVGKGLNSDGYRDNKSLQG